MRCDCCGDEIKSRRKGELDFNRVVSGRIAMCLCYYCSHDIHMQLSLGTLWLRGKQADEVRVTKNMLGDDVYGSATVFDGGKMIFHQE